MIFFKKERVGGGSTVEGNPNDQEKKKLCAIDFVTLFQIALGVYQI